MSGARLAVLASGQGSNYAALEGAIERGDLPARIVLVISDVAGAPVLARARSHGVPTLHLGPEAGEDAHGRYSRARYGAALAELLEQHGADYVVLAGFMRMLGGEVLRRYEHRIVNVHPSLLPAFPGLDAQRQAWEYGVKVSGCTVHLVDEGMDAGPVLAQHAVAVLPDDTVEALTRRIQAAEHQLYWRTVKQLISGELRFEGRRCLTEGSMRP